jgi:hypothetical protein
VFNALFELPIGEEEGGKPPALSGMGARRIQFPLDYEFQA